MRFTDLKKSLENGERFSVYIVEGEDAYFRDLALDALKKAFVREPTLNVAVFDGENPDKSGIAASLAATPFLSEYRMTVIRDFYPKANAFNGALREFFDTPVKNSVLVVVNEKKHDLFAKLKNAVSVDCGAADIPLIARWIKATAAGARVTVSETTAGAIAEYCLSDMARVKNETEKLIAYAGENGEITREAVDLLVYRDSEYKIYEMTDHIAKKKFGLAVGVIQDMLDKGDTPAKILSSVYGYFRRLFFVAISDKTNAETAALLGIKEYAVKKTREQAAAFKVRALKNAVDRLCDADTAVKSGKYAADDLMWINVFRIMTE